MAEDNYLYPEQYYHIYNRGNNKEIIFFEDKNYLYFLNLLSKYIHPIADIFCYCLLPNHFHLMIRIRANGLDIDDDTDYMKYCSKAFGNMFNAYTKAVNKQYGRTGSLFQKPFHRKRIDDDSYFQNALFYIHYNPQKHGLVKKFDKWKWSSYYSLLANGPTKLCRDEVLEWFTDKEGVIKFHQGLLDEKIAGDIFGDND